MNNKVLTGVLSLCLVALAASVGFNVGLSKNITASAAESAAQTELVRAEVTAPQQEQNTEKALYPEPLAQINTQDAQAAATPKAKCDICKAEFPETQLTKMNCGEHKACGSCIRSAGAEEHNSALPCGAYACDGRDHYMEPINCYCPSEPQHYACECSDPTHYCEACGETYTCSQSNCHAKCVHCGKPWCTNGGNHSLCGHCGEYCCNGSDHSHCGYDWCPYYNCQEHYHCPCCTAIVRWPGQHMYWECGQWKYSCAIHWCDPCVKDPCAGDIWGKKDPFSDPFSRKDKSPETAGMLLAEEPLTEKSA